MAITLKAARVNKGLRQDQAAQRLGITADTLRSYETYRSFPDVPMIKKMEELYGMSYNDLIFLPQDNG